METTVRPATEDDLGAVNDVYNHYVRTSAVTFDLEEWTLDQRRQWLAEHGTERHRVFVAVGPGGLVEGFATSGAWRPKAAYARTVETSVYVAPDATGRGVGSALYRALFDALDGADVHMAVAGMTLPNEASRALHVAFGFRPVGVFHEQGFKFGRCWDVEWFERLLRARRHPGPALASRRPRRQNRPGHGFGRRERA